jgi:hypothetical protein
MDERRRNKFHKDDEKPLRIIKLGKATIKNGRPDIVMDKALDVTLEKSTDSDAEDCFIRRVFGLSLDEGSDPLDPNPLDFLAVDPGHTIEEEVFPEEWL